MNLVSKLAPNCLTNVKVIDLIFLGQALSIIQSDEPINFLSPFIKPHE